MCEHDFIRATSDVRVHPIHAPENEFLWSEIVFFFDFRHALVSVVTVFFVHLGKKFKKYIMQRFI